VAAPPRRKLESYMFLFFFFESVSISLLYSNPNPKISQKLSSTVDLKKKNRIPLLPFRSTLLPPSSLFVLDLDSGSCLWPWVVRCRCVGLWVCVPRGCCVRVRPD